YAQAESITLLTNAEGRIAGIDRRLLLPAEAPLEPVREQIIGKYGQPADERPHLRWWERKPEAACENAGLQSNSPTLTEGTEQRNSAGFPTLAKLALTPETAVSISYRTPADPNKDDVDRTGCGPILDVRIARQGPSPQGEGM